MITDPGLVPLGEMQDRRLNRLPDWWPAGLGLLVMAVPTIVSMARQTWALESGAHGPIVLSTGLWLLYHNGLESKTIDSASNADRVGWIAVLLVSLPIYVFGRAYDFISVEFVGLFGAFVAVFWQIHGRRAVIKNAFPLFYLALSVPPPGWLMASVTAPLQTFVSAASEQVAALSGFPIARQGVILQVGSYQLLVEEACSGLNSLFGLVAISLLYIYLAHRASLQHALVLLIAVVPIAILVNVVRIVALIAITYFFGDAAAQGFLHATAGLLLFAFGLLLIFLLDLLVSPFMRRDIVR